MKGQVSLYMSPRRMYYNPFADSNPTLARMAQCKDEIEWMPRPNFNYGPKFWKLVRAYHSVCWTDDRGREHYIIAQGRFKELEAAYAEYAAEELAKQVEKGIKP